MDSSDSVRRFEFLREIASGGFGSVFLTKVMHPDGFSRIAAVKLLHRRWSENEEIARRMRDEARLLGWLRHRNIVDVVDLTSLDGRAAIIMEYLEAADLKAIDLQLGHTKDALPPRAALDVVAAVASALDAAYNRPPYPGEKPLRVIHRDIKPSNIMIDDSGLVKVLDFGVARAEFDARESDTRELQFGSIDYMPPERLLFEPESPGSDVYSLGATLFEILGNEKLGKARGSPDKHQAFVADRMSYLRGTLGLSGALGTELEGLISRCLAYDAEARPEASDLVKDSRKLAKEIGGLTIQEWAETHVLSVVQSTVEGSDRFNPLTGRTLSEDRTSIAHAPIEKPSSGVETVQLVDGEAQTLPEMPGVALGSSSDAPGPPTLEELPSLDSLALQKKAPVEEDEWEDAPTRLEDPEKLRERMREEEETDHGEEEPAAKPFPDLKAGKPIVPRPTGGLDASMPLSIPGVSASLAAGVVDGATLLMDEGDGDAATMMMPEDQVEEASAGLGDEGATRLMPEDEIMGAESGSGDDATWLLPEGESGEGPAAPPPAPASAPAPAPPLGLGTPPPAAAGPANAPPLPDSMGSLGSETVFTAIGGEGTGPLDHTDTTVVGRVAASLLVFVIAGVIALGAGAVMFRDEISNLLGGGSDSVVEAPVPTAEQPVETPTVEAPSEPAVAAPDPLEGFDGSTVAFESLLEGTSRLVVRCKGVSAEGVKSVVLSEASVSRCVVTAYPSEGRQLMLAIPGETAAGLTRCFEGGERSCGS